MAHAAADAGADALSLVNTFLGISIDAKTRRPRLANVTGGLSGPAIKPLALRMVYQASRAVSIPVLGMGGITTTEDVIEFMLAGATAVQVGTAARPTPLPTSVPPAMRIRAQSSGLQAGCATGAIATMWTSWPASPEP